LFRAPLISLYPPRRGWRKGAILARKANGCSLLDASVDWFTVTLEDGLRSRFAEAKAIRIMKALVDGGSEQSSTNRLGFVGERVEHFFYGKRGDLLIVIGSGAVAASEASFFLSMASNVSRLDLSVTLRDDDIDRDWTAIAFKQCSMDGRVDSGLLKTHRIQGTPDGSTLYIGSRSSDRYFRIYDKTAESKGDWPERSWRWEVEYKKPRAGIVAARLLQFSGGPGAILDVVKSALADLRVILPYNGSTTGWIPKRPKTLTDTESRLRYTSRVVAPFISRLVDSVGETRVIDALENAHLTGKYHPPKRRPRDAP
jgi:hypothetical protein